MKKKGNKSAYPNSFGNCTSDSWTTGTSAASFAAGMRRFTGRYAASVSRSSIWAADTRQTGYRLFWWWFPLCTVSETFRNSSSVASRLDCVLFYQPSSFNAHYIMQGKQLIRLPSAVFEWASCAVLPCRVGPVHSGQCDTSWEASESANRPGSSNKESADERYAEMMLRNKAYKGWKTNC